MQRPSDRSANGAPGLHRGAVDRRAPVGSSSTRPGARNDTRIWDDALDVLALESILDEITEHAMVLLDDAGFPPLHVRVSMEVEEVR